MQTTRTAGKRAEFPDQVGTCGEFNHLTTAMYNGVLLIGHSAFEVSYKFTVFELVQDWLVGLLGTLCCFKGCLALQWARLPSPGP